MNHILSYLLIALSLLSCNLPTETLSTGELQEGPWRMEFDLGDEKLPFNFMLEQTNNSYHIKVTNAEEVIEITDIVRKGDSLFASLPVFDSEFKGLIKDTQSFVGYWHNYAKGKNYKIPFTAIHGKNYRFLEKDPVSAADFGGKWEVTFGSSNDPEEVCKAIGLFNQSGHEVTGTFITETGDYRFLEGCVCDDTLFLSCFDGSHAFLFKAIQNKEGTIQGDFWSGNHWHEPWTGIRNDSFALTHPDSLTYLKEGYDKLSFRFPDLNGDSVTLENERYRNKVVIVQIMGSWCPNCADETNLYADLFRKYHDKGLEIVALAYEKGEDFERNREKVIKMKDFFGAEYDFLLAGKAGKSYASQTLPMLNHVMSYPTSIFIDRSGKIRKIHTGFYGPGTGNIYIEYVEETQMFLEKLLNEPLPDQMAASN